ncbi:prepilin-type N-terminal cleavage/methylation domain-containing protein [candidate division NPL-UPA2 bacterium]|nr:prepilin-type N-terminal cleavage/methylation domain-containing protein [candidate division NPL-UPA2 bacterium]
MKGFTLLELLITLAIVATILGIIYGSYASSVGTMSDCRERVGLYREARLILEIISREISSAFVSDNNEKLRFEGAQDELHFSSASGRLVPGLEPTDIREISYYLGPEPDRNSLMRREQWPVDDDIREGGETLILIDDIESLNFSYYGEEDWQEEWLWEEEGRLPMAVKVTITFAGTETSFSTLINIPLGKKWDKKG